VSRGCRPLNLRIRSTALACKRATLGKLCLAPLTGRDPLRHGRGVEEIVMSGRIRLPPSCLRALFGARPRSCRLGGELVRAQFQPDGTAPRRAVPLCDDPGVLEQVSAKFNPERKRALDSNLAIVGVDRIPRVGIPPWAARRRRSGRFCSGVAPRSDGSKPRCITRSWKPPAARIGLGIECAWSARPQMGYNRLPDGPALDIHRREPGADALCFQCS